MLFVDGAYAFDDKAPRFHHVAAPTQAELQRLLHVIATRTSRALESQGLLLRDNETPSLDLEPDDGFEQLLGAAVHYRIATGPHAGRKALTFRTVASHPPPATPSASTAPAHRRSVRLDVPAKAGAPDVRWRSTQGASACASVCALWRIMSRYVGAGPSGPESAPG